MRGRAETGDEAGGRGRKCSPPHCPSCTERSRRHEQSPGGDDARADQPPVLADVVPDQLRPLLYTVEQGAELLQISRAHLYDYIADGRIRTVKLGRSRRIPPSALDEFVAELLAEQAESDEW